MTYIVEVVGIIAGIVYMIMGITKYGVWEGISISGGFMPLVCGGFLTLFCVLMLISKIKKGEKADSIDKKSPDPGGRDDCNPTVQLPCGVAWRMYCGRFFMAEVC